MYVCTNTSKSRVRNKYISIKIFFFRLEQLIDYRLSITYICYIIWRVYRFFWLILLYELIKYQVYVAYTICRVFDYRVTYSVRIFTNFWLCIELLTYFFTQFIGFLIIELHIFYTILANFTLVKLTNYRL